MLFIIVNSNYIITIKIILTIFFQHEAATEDLSNITYICNRIYCECKQCFAIISTNYFNKMIKLTKKGLHAEFFPGVWRRLKLTAKAHFNELFSECSSCKELIFI